MDASLANFNVGVASTWEQTTVDFISEPPKIDYHNPKTAAAATNIMLNAFRGEMTEIIQCSDLPQSVKNDAIAKVDMMIDAALKPGVDPDIQCAVQDVLGNTAETVVKDYFADLFHQMQEQQLLEQAEDALNSGNGYCNPGANGMTGGAGAQGGGATGRPESGQPAEAGNAAPGSFSAGAGGGNWLIKLAEALAKVQSSHLDNLMSAADRAAAAAEDMPAANETSATSDSGGEAGYRHEFRCRRQHRDPGILHEFGTCQ